MKALLTVLCGDALEKLRELPDESVQCCVTSPPYWGLRDYGTAKWDGGKADCDHEGDQRYYTEKTAAVCSADAFSEPGQANIDRLKQGRWRNNGTCVKCGAVKRDAQLGLEKTAEEYVARVVEVFREARRVLKDDGILWLNLGDSYAGSWGNYVAEGSTSAKALDKRRKDRYGVLKPPMADRSGKSGLKPKDLVGIPWMVAFALRADGWWLRQDIIWAKPNPMPESVTDRCTKSHEYLFLLTKSPRYFYDQEAIKKRCEDTSVARLGQNVEAQEGSDRVPGKTNGKMKAVRFGGNKQCPDTRLQSGKKWTPKMGGSGSSFPGHSGYTRADGSPMNGITVNKKSVWTVTTRGYKDAHFATYPPDLIKPCILAGSRPDDVVLDPFAGSGTTGQVALELGRKAILIELNPEYVELIHRRCNVTLGLPLYA